MRIRSDLLRVAVIAVVAALGVCVLLASADGQISRAQQNGHAGVGVDAIGSVSRRDGSAFAATVDRYIDQRLSVGELVRSEQEALVTAPPRLDDALWMAQALVIGQVEEQHLERPRGASESDPGSAARALVVSVVRSRDRTRTIVVQPVSLGLDVKGALVLEYVPTEDVLELGRRYALPVETDEVGALAPIRGHIYAVDGGGLLSRTSSEQSAATDAAFGESTDWLQSRFDALH